VKVGRAAGDTAPFLFQRPFPRCGRGCRGEATDACAGGAVTRRPLAPPTLALSPDSGWGSTTRSACRKNRPSVVPRRDILEGVEEAWSRLPHSGKILFRRFAAAQTRTTHWLQSNSCADVKLKEISPFSRTTSVYATSFRESSYWPPLPGQIISCRSLAEKRKLC
jgi:hypothetical protein